MAWAGVWVRGQAAVRESGKQRVERKSGMTEKGFEGNFLRGDAKNGV